MNRWSFIKSNLYVSMNPTLSCDQVCLQIWAHPQGRLPMMISKVRDWQVIDQWDHIFGKGYLAPIQSNLFVKTPGEAPQDATLLARPYWISSGEECTKSQLWLAHCRDSHCQRVPLLMFSGHCPFSIRNTGIDSLLFPSTITNLPSTPLC